MAVVILGGLVTSTLLNLFVVPSLYLRFGRRQSEPRACNWHERLNVSLRSPTLPSLEKRGEWAQLFCRCAARLTSAAF